jgi:hypothetical protein
MATTEIARPAASAAVPQIAARDVRREPQTVIVRVIGGEARHG